MKLVQHHSVEGWQGCCSAFVAQLHFLGPGSCLMLGVRTNAFSFARVNSIDVTYVDELAEDA
eukprot:11179693-Lingulodinium_polyedra.AAC.1